ncbi:beta-ketoacyl synthase N-terminal-like domain-containing protein [Paraburkholderia dilworthii]|uniref:beta-ketoacyl synthase N-terminal-like domain-containing protein n=1 Tax=Paraburkholderia dilworthii TaxID=948106 RepID=UPI0003FA160F|nr:beta-ketoacyl synthase N-terminal-like domain-containing protein [Paraburkholderia dilworthii]
MNRLGIQIASWEALSPVGTGSSAFRATGDATAAPQGLSPELAALDFPTDIQYRPTYFDAPAILGTKGIRTLDRTTALTLSTATLLHQRMGRPDGVPLDRTGFVVGTSTGSIRSTSDFTRESLIQPRPFLVNPALFPNTVMNCAAGQCGIRFKAQSVNATISGGRLSGLLAFKYASQMLRRGYVDMLITGSVEELCPQSAWAHRQLIAHGCRRDVPLGEGCSMFALAGPTVTQTLASTVSGSVSDILALQYGRYFDPLAARATAVEGIQACIGDALAQAGIEAREIDRSVLCASSDVGNGELEMLAATHVFGSQLAADSGNLVEQFGDTYSATFSLAVGWLLGQAEDAGKQTHGLVLATSEDGHAGCLIVRTAAH